MEKNSIKMPDVNLSLSFLVSYAKCAPMTGPTVYTPEHPEILTDIDVDALMSHFLYSTPRGPVLEEFGNRVGYATTYAFLLGLDDEPIDKVRKFRIFVPFWFIFFNLLFDFPGQIRPDLAHDAQLHLQDHGKRRGAEVGVLRRRRRRRTGVLLSRADGARDRRPDDRRRRRRLDRRRRRRKRIVKFLG